MDIPFEKLVTSHKIIPLRDDEFLFVQNVYNDLLFLEQAVNDNVSLIDNLFASNRSFLWLVAQKAFIRNRTLTFSFGENFSEVKELLLENCPETSYREK